MNEKPDRYWNYRFVRDDAAGEGTEPWISLKEVYYDEHGNARGYCEPCLGSDSIEGCQWLTARWADAAQKPVIDVSEFYDNDEVQNV